MKINIFYLLSKISIILISLLCILSILLFYNNAVTLNSLYILISLLIIGSVIRLNKLKKFTRVLFTIIILPILSYFGNTLIVISAEAAGAVTKVKVVPETV